MHRKYNSNKSLHFIFVENESKNRRNKVGNELRGAKWRVEIISFRVCAACGLLVKRFVVVGIENVKKRKSKIHCALADGKRRETKFQRYGHARIAISRCARARCSDTRTHGSVGAAIFVVALTRWKNNRHRRPRLRFHGRVSPQLFAVYTPLRATARACLCTRRSTRV